MPFPAIRRLYMFIWVYPLKGLQVLVIIRLAVQHFSGRHITHRTEQPSSLLFQEESEIT